jgi:cytochrome c553
MNRGIRPSLVSVSVVLGVTALLTAGQSHADNSLAAKIANADVGYGEYLSGECVTCHQKSGQSRGIPAIAGLEAETFVSIMNAYRNKELENKVMQMVAGRLDDEQIISLAAYFSKLPSK